ncbi:YoaK family protein [Levilactobacillus tujiorum]|uniref:YoaK family protein n=1 Tax=Levilactobacillus tujiorum TaxID=2912243 RepID=UPI002FCDAA7B
MTSATTGQFRPLTDTILTLGATLLMGAIDADTFLEHGEVFVSAQTGNLVVGVVKLVTAGWQSAWTNGFVWGGYFLGCFVAQGLSERIGRGNRQRQMRWLMLFDVLAYTILASVQGKLLDPWLIFFLGIVAGYELTIFRQVGGVAINNGIMTGNTKTLATSCYQALINHDRQATQRVLRLVSVLVVFLTGCAIGVGLARLAAVDVLWVASGFKLLLLGWLFVPAAVEKPRK